MSFPESAEENHSRKNYCLQLPAYASIASECKPQKARRLIIRINESIQHKAQAQIQHQKSIHDERKYE